MNYAIHPICGASHRNCQSTLCLQDHRHLHEEPVEVLPEITNFKQLKITKPFLPPSLDFPQIRESETTFVI